MNKSQNYLVLLLDEATNVSFTQIVTAATGIDAGAYALSFDMSGRVREDGYKVLLVVSSRDLRIFADKLDTCSGAMVPRSDLSKIQFDEGVIISD